jgi:hypothetical protein
MAWRNREEEKLERREEQARQEAQGEKKGEDKPKRSWKEIDAKRDGARTDSRRDDRGPPRQKGESPHYRNYKSKLDKLFDGQIKMGETTAVEVVRPKEEPKASTPLPPMASAPATPRERLKAATDDAAIVAATKELLPNLPLDNELLLKVLSQDADPNLYLAALETLLDALEKGRPKNAKLIVARIDVILPLLSADAADLAKGLKSRIG